MCLSMELTVVPLVNVHNVKMCIQLELVLINPLWPLYTFVNYNTAPAQGLIDQFQLLMYRPCLFITMLASD